MKKPGQSSGRLPRKAHRGSGVLPFRTGNTGVAEAMFPGLADRATGRPFQLSGAQPEGRTRNILILNQTPLPLG